MAKGQIATAYVQVVPSMEGVAPKVKSYFKDAGDSSGESFGSNLIGKVKSVIAAAGIGKALGAALTEGAALEQSLGGVETMFKDSAGTVIANARQAYKTAGLSANSYMEQVTSFSASLLQSLGGDTAKAADTADMALRDMSDNANKFGSDMASIQNAYQGFAKQNYTMLDNLKLGYGGTKTEMERLLADAQKLTGVKYDISNLSDVYNAIHAIQEELDITGTTALEAATTLTGSFNSMKAAASNVLGSLTLGEDIKPSLNALADTTITFLSGNLLPAIGNILSALPGALVTTISAVLENLNGGLRLVVGTLAALGAGLAIQKLVQSFQMAQVQVSLLTMEIGKANLAQAALNGTMSIGQAAVALLTGKMSLATFAQAAMTKATGALNAVMSANPIALVVAAVGALGAVIYNNIAKINTLADSMVVQASTSSEAEESLAALQARFAEFEGNPNKWGKEKREEYLALKQAISETETQLAQLQQTETEAAIAAAEAAADPVNVFKAATEQYSQDATALYENFVTTYQGMFDQVSGWFKPFQEATASVETSIDDMMAAMQSQIDFNTTYSANLAALKEYGLGSLSEAFQTYGANGAAYAQAIVQAVEQAGGATSTGGQKIIQGFADINQRVTASQETLSLTMSTMSGEFDSQMQSITDTYSAAIADLDKSAEAKSAAVSTIRAFIAGLNSEIPGVRSALADIGGQMTRALQSGVGTVTIPTKTSGSGGGRNLTTYVNGAYATGLDYVPFDGFIAELHRGEMVVPAKEASQLRNVGAPSTYRSNNFTFNVYAAQGQDENALVERLMQRIQFEVSRRGWRLRDREPLVFV